MSKSNFDKNDNDPNSEPKMMESLDSGHFSYNFTDWIEDTGGNEPQDQIVYLFHYDYVVF